MDIRVAEECAINHLNGAINVPLAIQLLKVLAIERF